MLPSKIRSIKQPNWTDELHWNVHLSGRCVTDVDHDWRVSCDVNGKDAVYWNKGTPFNRTYCTTLIEALAGLDYRPDA